VEPERQVEIQLGHMCNNRCVFCVSGQRTALGEAGPMPLGPILERIREARAAGHLKITILGGEPTLQPGFLEVVKETVALGFEEIVVFTNGAKTARAEMIDEIRATGGRFTWRISIQGATRESHERTTRKPGSFDRILRTLEHLSARGERITVNMCVVSSNFEDVEHFAPLLLPYGVSQLHLDMVRPLDAGDRSEEELRAMLPRLPELRAPLTRMVRAFPEGFDVNLGNVPYCAAPELAPWIHHDGQPTQTIAIDGDDRLSRPWDKYFVKRRDKLKDERCSACVLSPRCSGVFETYARFYGLGELEPIDARTLAKLDPDGKLLGVWAPAILQIGEAISDREVRLEVGESTIYLRPPREVAGAIARYERFTVHGAVRTEDVPRIAPLLADLAQPIHPIGADGDASVAPALRAAIGRVRSSAPFGALRFAALGIDGARADLRFEGEAAIVQLWIALRGGRPSGGYRVEGQASDADVTSLRAVLSALAGAP
jgi:MoaA/NifB/PqqE/SkfB family radical SAM enzyme